MPSLYQKLTRFEFWPFQLFYTPVYLHLLAAAMRKGRLAGFVAANPGIPFGGLLEYSKQAISEQLPQQKVPQTVVVSMSSSLAQVESALGVQRLEYPLILKPDRGERGFMVEKVSDRHALADYLSRAHSFCRKLNDAGLNGATEKLLIQRYVDEPSEFGVMYVRRPGARRGTITSIVHKELLSVTGDGVSTLEALIDRGERTRIHRQMLLDRVGEDRSTILASGERRYLVEIGNHARGATFRDATALVSDTLVSRIEPLARSIDGFFVGRFDIRCRDFAALESDAFHVIEVNGVNSEPAHIYDPEKSLLSAYRDLLGHWREVERISWVNRRNGTPVPSVRALLSAIRRHNTRLRVQAGR